MASKKYQIDPETRALIVRELAEALVLDYQHVRETMVNSPHGIDHKTRAQNDKIVV